MIDPELMSKSALIQELYRLSAVKNDLLDALKDMMDAQMDNISNAQYSAAFDKAHKTILKTEG